ncbi:hypothetical protein REPUB_Repub03eG0131100 [Reevesia pubescens]
MRERCLTRHDVGREEFVNEAREAAMAVQGKMVDRKRAMNFRAEEIKVDGILGQQALALHLLASVLDKALHNIYLNPVASTLANNNKVDGAVDWELFGLWHCHLFFHCFF